MTLRCTAPCVPSCKNSATFKLLNYQSRSVLGENCDDHLKPLLVSRPKSTPDYDKAPLDPEVQSEA